MEFEHMQDSVDFLCKDIYTNPKHYTITTGTFGSNSSIRYVIGEGKCIVSTKTDGRINRVFSDTQGIQLAGAYNYLESQQGIVAQQRIEESIKSQIKLNELIVIQDAWLKRLSEQSIRMLENTPPPKWYHKYI
jgi:hypothetical protein